MVIILVLEAVWRVGEQTSIHEIFYFKWPHTPPAVHPQATRGPWPTLWESLVLIVLHWKFKRHQQNFLTWLNWTYLLCLCCWCLLENFNAKRQLTSQLRWPSFYYSLCVCAHRTGNLSVKLFLYIQLFLSWCFWLQCLCAEWPLQ